MDAPAPASAEPAADPVAHAEPEPEPEEAPSIVPAPQPAEPEDRNTKRGNARASLSWHATAAAMGAWETAPRLALGGRLGVAARRERWSLGLEAWSTLPAARAGTYGGEVQVRLISAAAVPCFRLSRPLSLCAPVSLGAMHAEGRGIDAARAEDVLYATTGVRASMAFPLGERLELLASADLAVALNRPRFQLDHNDVWRPGLLVALLGLGAAARFF